MKFRLNENNSKLILTESTSEEYNQLRLYLDRYVYNWRFKVKKSMGTWDGKTNLFKDGFLDFGLWHEAQKCCKKFGYPFVIQNKDKFPMNKDLKYEDVESFCKEFYKDHKDKDDITKPLTPYDHQMISIYKTLKYRYGLIEVGTGGGKSLIFGTLLFYYLTKINPDAKILLIVPNMDLVTQFYNEIMDYNFGFHKENQNPIKNLRIDEIFSEKPRKYYGEELPNIYIGTYQSLIKWPKEWFRQFDVVCCDEGHSIKSATISEIMNRTYGWAKIRFGMSGTFPSETEMPAELFTIESLTGPILYSIKAKELVAKGIITNMKVNCIVLNYEDKVFAENVFSIKKNGDGKRAYELEKKYAQSSLKRKIFMAKLVQKFKYNSIVLFHNRKYGKELYEYFRDNIPDMDFYYIDGTVPKNKRLHIRKMMEDTEGKVKILVATFGTTGTGINIKSLTNMVFADSFKSDRIVRQSIGRALRLHSMKDKAIIFDIVDRFHSSFKNVLYNHYITRRKEIYDRHEYPYKEIKFTI